MIHHLKSSDFLHRFVLCCAVLFAAAPVPAQTPLPGFPGAVGWAANTPGGRGGKIIKVTNLNADGPGSFKEAIETKGPRIVVFEVGGVIDLGRTTLTIREPFITLAGQTAPSPGITLIRAGIDVRQLFQDVEVLQPTVRLQHCLAQGRLAQHDEPKK